jgi:hypothetical protein
MAWLFRLRFLPLALIAMIFAAPGNAQTQIDVDWARANTCPSLDRFVARYGSSNSYSGEIGARRSRCPRRPTPQRAPTARPPVAASRPAATNYVRTAQDESERRIVGQLNQRILERNQAVNAQNRANQEDFARRRAAYQRQVQASDLANQRHQREVAEYRRRLAEHRRLLATGNFGPAR